MSWKDEYTEDLKKEEMKVFEIMESFAKANDGRLPNKSQLARAANISMYKTDEIQKALETKGVIKKEENKKIVLKGSRLLKEKTQIYKEVPGVFKGKKQIKSALIPYIKKVKDPENILNPENILEYIAVPFNFQREENMFAFNVPKKGMHSAKKSLNIGNIAIVDMKAEYLSKDYVAKIYYDENIIALDEYFMYKENKLKKTNGENQYKILGKVVGSFKAFTDWDLK